jgi:cysteinyl-tRNA synthetase
MSSQPSFFDTRARSVEPFEPESPPEVTVYACGPTVYDHPHVGNYRYFVWVDVLRRYLDSCGYAVRLVMNVTDVDDKTIARAIESGQELSAFTEPYERSFRQGLDFLGILPAAEYPRATEHVGDMIAMISKLLAEGHAYQVGGNVFFRVASFPAYGQLAHRDADQMQTTERVEGDDFGKEDPRDFALWKAAKPGEPAWEAPFGPGRPGWHLECSVMSMRYLGESFDLHVGGADLMFPHHENEIAQSVAATGAEFARRWMHCQHLIVDGQKMSKSLGNFVTLDSLRGAGHSGAALRYMLLSVHYRRQLNMTTEALEQAAASVQRLRDTSRRVREAEEAGAAGNSESAVTASLGAAREGFAAALADDLNTAGALGSLFTFVRELNVALDAGVCSTEELRATAEWFEEVDDILAVIDEAEMDVTIDVDGTSLRAVGPPIAAAAAELVRERLRARAGRDFQRSDELRDELAALGVQVEDAADGGRWKLAAPRVD